MPTVRTTVSPTFTLAGVIVCVTSTSALRFTAIPIDAELFARFGSDAPAGGVMLAVSTSRPAASDATVAVTVKAITPAAGRLTAALMLPAPLDAGHAAPPVAAHVQVTPVSTAGKLSTTTAPIASLGPPLNALIRYIVVAPGIATLPKLLLVMPR